MTIDERHIAVAMRTMADEVPASAPPARQLLARGVRQRRGRRALLAGTALGVIALAAATIPYAAPAGRSPAHTPPAAVSDLDRLVLAAQRTSQTGFRFTVHTHVAPVPAGDVPAYQPASYVGGSDPSVPKGYVRETAPAGFAFEIRVIGPNCYFRRGISTGFIHRCLTDDPDQRLFVPATQNTGLQNVTMSVDPQAQIENLKKLGTVKHVDRSGGVDRYTFSYALNPGSPGSTERIQGTIEVAVGSGMISQIAFKEVMHSPRLEDFTVWATIAYSDYGKPVEVAVP
jgi:hypothetical protein